MKGKCGRRTGPSCVRDEDRPRKSAHAEPRWDPRIRPSTVRTTPPVPSLRYLRVRRSTRRAGQGRVLMLACAAKRTLEAPKRAPQKSRAERRRHCTSASE
jgi:hypothetical protein